jgi:hypothetical protein
MLHELIAHTRALPLVLLLALGGTQAFAGCRSKQPGSRRPAQCHKSRPCCKPMMRESDMSMEESVDITGLMPFLQRIHALAEEGDCCAELIQYCGCNHGNKPKAPYSAVIRMIDNCSTILEKRHDKIAQDCQLQELAAGFESYMDSLECSMMEKEGDASMIHRSCRVSKLDNLLLRNRLRVLGEASFCRNVSVCGNLSVAGEIESGLLTTNFLTVNGDTNLRGDTSIGCGSAVNGTVPTLTVCANTIFDGDVIFREGISFEECITGPFCVDGTSSFNGDVNIGNAGVPGTLSVNNVSAFNADVLIGCPPGAPADLTVCGDTNLNGDVNIGCLLGATGVLNVCADANFSGSVNFSGDVTVTGTFTAPGIPCVRGGAVLVPLVGDATVFRGEGFTVETLSAFPASAIVITFDDPISIISANVMQEGLNLLPLSVAVAGNTITITLTGLPLVSPILDFVVVCA